MRFYTNQPRFYCGIDRYARSLSLCILNQEGDIVVWSKTSSSLAVSTTLKFFNGDEFIEGTGGGYENFLYLPFSPAFVVAASRRQASLQRRGI